MKLRLKGNSLRLRLGRSEVAALLRGDTLEESTAFGPLPSQQLSYLLGATPEKHITATLEHARIHVHVPRNVIHRWATTDDLSITAEQPIGTDASLRILIEKDLECLDPSAAESQEDAFTNPRSTACDHRSVEQESAP
jgi:hypothetical protein